MARRQQAALLKGRELPVAAEALLRFRTSATVGETEAQRKVIRAETLPGAYSVNSIMSLFSLFGSKTSHGSPVPSE